MNQAKADTRRRVLAARDALSPEYRHAASQAIAAQIMRLPSFLRARTVLLFSPFGSEWAADLVLDEALRLEKTVVLPRVAKGEKRLALCAIGDKEKDTVPGVFGILEPCARCARVAPPMIDWALVPGVAFSVLRQRLGYGAGYYDRLLPQVLSRVSLVAGAFDVQIQPSLPITEYDVPVDMVVSESRCLGAEKPA